MQELAELAMRVAELERKLAGMVRHGTVAEVDTAQGLVRLKFGTADGGGDFLGPWVPYGQTAGAVKAHIPPSVGQQMTVISPSGDWRQSIALPMTWSNENASPGSGADPVITYGSVRIEVRTDGVKVSVGGASVELTANAFKMLADLVKAEGASLKHNAKEVGDKHGHETAPPGPPGPPV